MHSEYPKKKPVNSGWLIDERSSKKKSWIIVILICFVAIIIHGLFIGILYLGWNSNLLLKASLGDKKPELVYELVYDEPKEEGFVETNSNLVPEVPPEKTNNFAAQSQQAAQEVLADRSKKDRAPTVDGDDEMFSKIVQGFVDPQEGISGIPDLVREEDSLIVLEEKEESMEGRKSRPKPKPRPQIKRLLAGAMNKHDGAAAKVGPVAVDAKFSQFGAYLEKMFESIGYQFYTLFENYSRTAADFNSYVRLAYLIDENGNVTNIEVVGATASNLAIILCKDVVLSPAPFGPWTDEMKIVLGKQQTIKVGFYFP